MGKPKHLLNSQANDLARSIREASLNQADFIWTTTEISDSPYPDPATVYTVDVLLYRPAANTFFRFGRTHVMYSPGHDRVEEQGATPDWHQTKRYFAHWLTIIKREAEPSLWDQIAEGTTLPAGALDAPRTRFTTEEQVALLARLDEMAQRIEALDALTREQKRLVSAELQNIGAAIGHMERGEWLRFAIGGMMTVLLSGDLQHSVAASLLRWAVSVFHTAVTGGPMPPLLLSP